MHDVTSIQTSQPGASPVGRLVFGLSILAMLALALAPHQVGLF